MKLTPAQLRRIIKEEASKLAKEGIDWDPGMPSATAKVQQLIRDAAQAAAAAGLDRLDFIDECGIVFDEFAEKSKPYVRIADRKKEWP